MPIRIAKEEQEYPYGTKRKVGDKFEVEPDHVRLLLYLGRIEPEPGEMGYQTRDMSAQEPAKYRTREILHKPKRQAH